MEIKLQAQVRELKEKMDKNSVAAVLYGQGVANQNLKLGRLDLEKAFALAGESNLIDLEVAGGQSVKVLVKETQYEPLKGTLRHIDFYQVNMAKKINTEIPLHFVGESKAIKELGGMLVKNLDHLEVECLPIDLVDHIDVDISTITELHHPIKISDLALPKGWELENDPNDLVAIIVEPKEEEVAPVAPVAEVAPAAAAPVKDEKSEKK